MDLQADIKWIQNELNEVKDPTLIEAFKNLLKYRRNNTTNFDLIQYNKELESSEKEIENGNHFTQDQIRKAASQWGRK